MRRFSIWALVFLFITALFPVGASAEPAKSKRLTIELSGQFADNKDLILTASLKDVKNIKGNWTIKWDNKTVQEEKDSNKATFSFTIPNSKMHLQVHYLEISYSGKTKDQSINGYRKLKLEKKQSTPENGNGDVDSNAGNQQNPSSTAGNEQNPNATAGNEQNPSSTAGNEQNPNATAGNEQNPSSTAGNEQNPNATAGNEQNPSSTAGNEQNPNATAGNEQNPSSTAGNEQNPNATAGNEQNPSSTAGNEQNPNATAGNEQNPSSTAGNEQNPNATAGNEQNPSSTAGNEQNPNATAGNEQNPSSTADNEQNPNATAGNEQNPNSTSGSENNYVTPPATDQIKLGGPLPKTAGLAPTGIFVGFLLLISGSLLYLYFQRKQTL
ncbi:hypothetical protein SAMN05444392_104125 [Seinonella peptonophila]|uniref:LPXTG-motif cell wall anchor domain-containing protein n=1 Tax=Seinonella peptonophila TaxID=112248 RepID=A0A1M4X4U8_9BACL|nr:hypothetical protein [Seinonella peptonophila]SHE88514.1 hypothetical protein SAMN05444392_104125 [Seinonella peptonophila]